MRFKKRILLLITILGLGLGCGSFENILPDREKEYKYSTEIPPLEVPPDLTASTIESSPIRPLIGGERPSTGSVPEESRQPVSRDELPETGKPEPAPDVEHSEQGAYVSIQENFSITWRMVGRALSRLEIELEDVNRSEGLYYIIFEDKRKRPADDSFWSRLAFWSDANSIEEQRFRVLVEGKSDTTQVRIQDEEGSGLSEGAGLNLLQMIQKEINDQIDEK
ncbi:MAG: outer membrane protein assembly factor BamC [Methylococcaceae bacterium]|nr:outer membrane protein assembly factor BamC [Methylococcaceae bacterium]